jgi:hypothetical protein
MATKEWEGKEIYRYPSQKIKKRMAINTCIRLAFFNIPLHISISKNNHPHHHYTIRKVHSSLAIDRLIKDLEGDGCGIFTVIISKIAGKTQENKKSSLRMRSSPVEIWIWYFMNAYLDRYGFSSLVSVIALKYRRWLDVHSFELGKDAIRMLKLVVIQPLA